MSLLATIVIIILPCGHDQSTVLTPSACMHGALQHNRVGLAYIEIVLYMWAGPGQLATCNSGPGQSTFVYYYCIAEKILA